MCTNTQIFEMEPPGADDNATCSEVVESASYRRTCLPQSAVSRVFDMAEPLGLIFLFCISEWQDTLRGVNIWSLNIIMRKRYPRPSKNEAPLLFTRICWQWRKTALATPRLWAHLQIDLTGRSWNLPSSEVCLTALRFWMTHSGAVPVSINFDCNKASWMEATQACIDSVTRKKHANVLEILKVLCKHSHHWENICLAIPNFATGLIFGILDRDLPALKTFEFNSYSLRSALRDRRNMSIRSAPVIQEPVLHSQDYMVVPDGIPLGLRVLQLASMKMRLIKV